MNVGFISLGCSKNLVVTEEVIGLFKKRNFTIVNNEKDAAIIVINTCGFIESAKQEAIDTILEMAQYKDGRCKYLIVIGCMVERYEEELRKALPEVDLFIKIKDYNKIWTKISELLKLEISNECLSWKDRVITTGDTMSYLKIAEGCSNHCTYCAIPKIQGRYISREFGEIIEEAKSLSKKGIKELIVIAQDTTKYGIDLYKKPRLAELLQELCKIDGIEWIRFLYAYPESITDELIKVVKENDKICKYFDIPIQHISDEVLKRMNRKSDGESIRKLINKIRNQIPEAILRTSLIVGFPGETEEDFNKLYEFVRDTRFDKLGTFIYSKEDGTPAEKMENQIHLNTKKARYNKIMKLQQEISEEILKGKVGKTYKTLIEERSFDGKYLIGRTYMDVPDEDGVVFIENTTDKDLIGKFVDVEIVNVQEYDLIGKLRKE
ncbi:MAG: 30S ribosomal protein S12 methylthiotransferase RimO [Clostridia bacterium]|nr:30S ribosomal protein S12 methylthiotransferase RimO [Clostridia bacterium]